jgi:hypothetical protein
MLVTFPFKFNNRWLHVGQERVLPFERATDWTASCKTDRSCSLSSPLCYRINNEGDSRLIRKMMNNKWFSGVPAISMRQSHSWKLDNHSADQEVPLLSWKLKLITVPTAYHRYVTWPTWIWSTPSLISSHLRVCLTNTPFTLQLLRVHCWMHSSFPLLGICSNSLVSITWLPSWYLRKGENKNFPQYLPATSVVSAFSCWNINRVSCSNQYCSNATLLSLQREIWRRGYFIFLWAWSKYKPHIFFPHNFN